MAGRVFVKDDINSWFVEKHYNWTFLFGDNMQQKGRGGQAKIMRGKHNTIGIPTKWAPTYKDEAYFKDEDWFNPEVHKAIKGSLNLIEKRLESGVVIVIPAKGIGTGLSQLDIRAPKIFAYIKNRLDGLGVPRTLE